MENIPAELLTQILHAHAINHEGLVHLWTEVRHVSRDIKYSVEQLFASRILPQTKIWLSEESYIYGDQRHGHRRGTFPSGCCDPGIRTQADDQFVFTGFSENRKEAIFSPRQPVTDNIVKKLKALEGDNAMKNMLVKPCHIVQIRDKVNDIYLPEINVNHEDLSLRVNWKAMFSLFFAEGKQYLSACRDWVDHPQWDRLSDGFRKCEEYYMYESHPGSTSLTDQFGEMIAAAQEAERHIRLRRISRLYVNLLTEPLIANEEYFESEWIALQRIDDHRYKIAEANPVAGGLACSRSDSNCWGMPMSI